MLFSDLKNKKVVVMGLGLYKEGSGVMAARFFAKRGARVLVTDLREENELAPALRRLKHFKNISYVLGRHRPKDFRTADLIFQNPSVPATSPYLKIALKAGVPIVNDWSIFLSLCQPKFLIGVTGTRGKSTTTTLIYEMIRRKHKRARLAGNLGVSPLSFIDSYRNEPIVAELSSWLLHHFSTIKKSPQVSVVTNILRDHLDKYPSMREYIADKENIFRFQKKEDMVVLNYDNLITRQLAKKAPGRVLWFSLKPLPSYLEGASLWKETLVFQQAQRQINFLPMNQLKIIGWHNIANALAALTVAWTIGISKKDIVYVLKTFSGLPNRLELIAEIEGVKYYNDTTATTPDATIAALLSLSFQDKNQKNSSREPLPLAQKKIVLIAGGSDKNLEYKQLAKYIKDYCKAVILLPGTATEKLKSEIANYKLEKREALNMKEAVTLAKNFALEGDIVLLSPGAASFGLFKNEFDRGKQFVKLVNSLAKQKIEKKKR
jgi:UDP-N-acetylmuramoylalanine--D-glutamate ligase